MAMMQQQKDFFVQSQAQAAAQAQATAQAQAVAQAQAQAQAAATLAGQQQLSELMGTSLPRILVNSDVTSIPVAHQFVVNSSDDVCDTVIPLVVCRLLYLTLLCLYSPAQVTFFIQASANHGGSWH